MQAAKEAESSGNPVRGIKGQSLPAPVLNLADSIPVDYMHAVLEGVTEWLLHAWFNSENHREPYYIGRSVRQVDSILLNQRPPSEFSRPPRSIQNHRSYWRAFELSNWLLYYSLPVLMDFLPAMFLHHYALLVCSLHIPLQDSLTHAQIDAAEAMICDFVGLLPELYGNKSCTANSHSLTHLTKYVRLWGPLWTHSAFGFESHNGSLKHLFHSWSNIVDQLVFNVEVQQTLQLLQPTLQQETSEFLEVYTTLNGSGQRRGMQRVGDRILRRWMSFPKETTAGWLLTSWNNSRSYTNILKSFYKWSTLSLFLVFQGPGQKGQHSLPFSYWHKLQVWTNTGLRTHSHPWSDCSSIYRNEQYLSELSWAPVSSYSSWVQRDRFLGRFCARN